MDLGYLSMPFSDAGINGVPRAEDGMVSEAGIWSS